MVETKKSIPRLEDLPDAPEEFDMISEADAAMPTPPSVKQVIEVDIEEVDHVAVSVNLPSIEDLPEDWVLVIDAPLQVETRIKTTLPALWERVRGERVERVIATSSTQLFYFRDETLTYHCHAMPKAVADEFAKWAGAQVFVRRVQQTYTECELYRHHGIVLHDRAYPVIVLLPSTGSLRSMVTSYSWPLTIVDLPARTEVIKRSKLVMEDPRAMLA